MTRLERSVGVVIVASLALLDGLSSRRLALGAIPPRPAGPSATPEKPPRFSHLTHRDRGVELSCSACHLGQPDGALRWPTEDHKPCANSACHAAEFRAPNSPFCYACHEKNVPFRPNPTRVVFERSGAFALIFPHRVHVQRGMPCGFCHPGPANLPPSVNPRYALAAAHAICGSCHEAMSLPRMTDCVTCHRLGEVPSRMAENPWAVHDKFRHSDHRFDVRLQQGLPNGPRGPANLATAQTPLTCTVCHIDPLSLPSDELPRPTMQSCIVCHNGAEAFKATGFACTRCHVDVMAPERPGS